MKKFILFIGLILNTLIGFSQIEFQGVTHINHSPGMEIGFDVLNTSEDIIENLQIQLRRITPHHPASSLVFQFLSPHLQPGASKVIYPFNQCVDVGPDMIFEAKITRVNYISIPHINYIFTLPYDGDIRCISDIIINPSTNSESTALFCEECGVLSSIEETDNTELILKTEYYTTVGQNVPFEELQPNVLYIIKETTQTGFKIYKTIIQ